MLHYRQTEPCSPSCLASALIDSVEALGQPWNMLWLDTLSLISNGQGWIARIELPLHCDKIVVTTVLQRIYNQITHRTVEFRCIT